MVDKNDLDVAGKLGGFKNGKGQLTAGLMTTTRESVRLKDAK